MSSVSTLWTSLQLAWSWRTVADGCLARTLPTIIFAASTFCAFTIAGGFTSSISSGIGNDVLIGDPRCALLTDTSLSSDTLSVIYPLVSQSMNNAANYAQQCYSSNATGSLDCTTFVNSRLQFKSVLNASCPFSDNMCRSNDSNLLLDSGLISSDDLGLNMPISQRMFFREVVQCAPLKTDGFARNVSAVHNNYTRYSYGGNSYSNWTYEAVTLGAKDRRRDDYPSMRGTKGFNIVPMISRVANGTVWINDGDFESIPQLTVPDADLLVIFLASEGTIFLNRTDDPWYRAIVPYRYLYFQGGRSILYTPDEAGSPMGCAMRYQYCNSSKKCGSLASFVDAVSSAVPLFHGSPSEFWSEFWSGGQVSREPDATESRFRMFQSIVRYSSDFYDVLGSLGPSALLSTQHLIHGLMGPLPDNQWQLDVSHWFAIRLASLQAAFVNTARGPADEALLPYFARTGNGVQLEMCNNQKILSTDYISLSLFGLYFTYVTGIVVVLGSYIVEPLLTLFYSCRKYEEYKYLEWAANSTLQLQRLAYQGLGSEKWSHYTDDIPKTRPGYFLADLARAYPEHDDDEVQEVKPTVHAASTTTPSVSEISANLRVSEQSRGDPSRPVSAVSELVPHAASPQAMSPQVVSPISQRPEA